MNVEELFKYIDTLRTHLKKDLIVDLKYLDAESAKNPLLVQKYIDEYFKILKLKNKASVAVDKLTEEKKTYYKTKHEFVPQNATELKILMAADTELSQAKEYLKTIDDVIFYLHETIENIKGKQWHIKNAIEFRKFSEGIV